MSTNKRDVTVLGDSLLDEYDDVEEAWNRCHGEFTQSQEQQGQDLSFASKKEDVVNDASLLADEEAKKEIKPPPKVGQSTVNDSGVVDNAVLRSSPRSNETSRATRSAPRIPTRRKGLQEPSDGSDTLPPNSHIVSHLATRNRSVRPGAVVVRGLDASSSVSEGFDDSPNVSEGTAVDTSEDHVSLPPSIPTLDAEPVDTAREERLMEQNQWLQEQNRRLEAERQLRDSSPVVAQAIPMDENNGWTCARLTSWSRWPKWLKIAVPVIAMILAILVATVAAFVAQSTTPDEPERTPASSPGEFPTPTPPPTSVSTQPPAPPPVVGGCYRSLTAIDQDERGLFDLDVVRTYILCPGTNFSTGFLTNEGDVLDGHLPISLRKNMRILCGENGSSANNCVIRTGSFGVTSIPSNYNNPVLNTGVVVQGVTFEDLTTYAVLVGLPGEYKFIDCIFRNNTCEDTPLLLEWYGGNARRGAQHRMGTLRGQFSSYYPPKHQSEPLEVNGKNGNRALQQTTTTLEVEFVDCVFSDNTCAPDSRLGLVVLGGDGVNAKFTNCLFRDNDYNVPGVNDINAYGIIIENFGNGPLAIENSCFLNNTAFGNSLVAEYGDALGSYTNNYGEGNSIEWTVDLECEFAALVSQTGVDFPNLACVDFDADECSVENI